MRRRAIVLLVGLVGGLGQMVVPAPATAASVFDSDPRFPLIAKINYTDCNPTCSAGLPFSGGAAPRSLLVDAARRQIYAYRSIDSATFPRGVAVIDADRLVQTGWIDLSGTKLANPPSDKFVAVAHDEKRGRLFLGETSHTLGCTNNAFEGDVLAPHQGCLTASRIAVVDLTQAAPNPVVFRLRPATNVQGSQMPPEPSEGDGIAGLAYDGGRERLYVLTSGGRNFDSGNLDPKGASVVAYDATALTAASAPLWTYRARSCPSALGQKGAPPYFDVGSDGSFVYFACRGTLLPVALPHGVVRVNLQESANGDPTAAFTTEFFPFAGSQAVSGFSLGDRAGDRVAIGVTGGGAQRMYVFDARRRAWVGSMLMGGANTGDGGADPGTGRIYVGSQGEGLSYIDAAALPAVVLKTPFTLGFDHGATMPALAVDPLTRRVMVPGPTFNLGAGGGGVVNNHLRVYQDRTPPFVPPTPKNPDDETHDIEEADAVQVTHTAAGSAYGAHAMLVRGVGGIIPSADAANDQLARDDRTAPFRLEGGDRGLFFSQIPGVELTGDNEAGSATASAVAARMDAATAADLKGKHGFVTGPFGIGDEGAEPCDPNVPGPECLAFDPLVSNVGEVHESACGDYGHEGDPKDGAQRGSMVKCRHLDQVSASASTSAGQPAAPGVVSFEVGHTESRVDAVKQPDGGVVTSSMAIARGVSLTVPGMGTLSIGELQSMATSRAEGRPDTAKSTFESIAKNARLTGADGKTLFSCGTPSIDADSADEGERCSPANVAIAINKYLAPRVQARGPRQELDPLIVNSPGGAKAVLEKDLYARWNDTNLNGDAQREVTALDLTIYNDSDEPSRLILKLAGVRSEAQYVIGEPKPDEFVGPTRLAVELVDEGGDPLAGGVFQVREAGDDDVLASLGGQAPAACVTGDDGVGDCAFDDLAAGDYVVTQTVAPAGYAPSEPVEVTLEPGFETSARITNLRAIGRIAISLTDDGGEDGAVAPLAGATFAVLADDGDLVRGAGDQPYDECTTDAAGECAFEDVPLGAYVVHQTSALDGYLLADDVGFVLELPGQASELSFVTGLEAIEGEEGEIGEEAGATPEEEPGETAFVDAPTETTTVVINDPPLRPIAQVTTRPLGRSSGLGRLAALPGQAISFLVRQPLQALFIGLVWILLGLPVYLAFRRRTLTVAKGVF